MGEVHTRMDGPGTGDSSTERSGDRSAAPRPSMVVVDAVAGVLDTDPLSLEPIANVLDPEALDQLVGSWDPGDGSTTASISFDYCGCTVTLESDGTLVVSRDGEVHRESW